MKGQITFTNLIGIMITILIYTTVAYPILEPLISDTVTDMQSDPNEYTAINVMLLQLVPFILLLGIIITALNYATPRIEDRGPYG